MAELEAPDSSPVPRRVHPLLDPLGITWMIWSAFTACIGGAVILLASGVGALLTTLPDSDTGRPLPFGLGVFFGGFGMAIGVAIVLFSLFGAAAGSAVREGRTWAKVALLILALLHLTSIPVGTALALWTFYALYQDLNASRPELIGPG